MTRYEVEMEGLIITGDAEIVNDTCPRIQIDSVRLARTRPQTDPEPLNVVTGRALFQAWLTELILNSYLGERLKAAVIHQANSRRIRK